MLSKRKMKLFWPNRKILFAIRDWERAPVMLDQYPFIIAALCSHFTSAPKRDRVGCVGVSHAIGGPALKNFRLGANVLPSPPEIRGMDVGFGGGGDPVADLIAEGDESSGAGF